MFSHYYGGGRHYHSGLTTRDPDIQTRQDLLKQLQRFLLISLIVSRADFSKIKVKGLYSHCFIVEHNWMFAKIIMFALDRQLSCYPAHHWYEWL